VAKKKQSQKAQALGGFRDPRNGEAARRVWEWETWLRSALTDYFSEAVEHQKIYLSQRKDHRKPWEKKWRAHTLQPYGWIICEAKTSVVSDIINAADPLMQVSGHGDEDLDTARRAERMVDFDLTQNRWRLFSQQVLREASYLGTSAFKVTWREDYSKVLDLDVAAEKQFSEFRRLMKAGAGMDVPKDPVEYEQWRAERIEEGYADLPDHPGRRVLDVNTFRGPSFDRVSLFDLRFNPMIEDWSQQPMIIQRIVKPKKWVLDRAGDDPRLPFDKESVQWAINALPEQRFQQWELEQAAMLGLSAATAGHPFSTNELCELWEVFDFEDEEAPYKVILNRVALINKDPRGMPYGHGECPIHLFRNIPHPGIALGMSEIKAPKKLFYELWTLRDLRLDSVTLQALPVFQKLNEMGVTEISKILEPGRSIPVSRLDAIKRLELGSVHPDVWREIEALKQEIDDSTSVYTSVRGQPATINRVSASESSQRSSSALTRLKTAATVFEEETRRAIRQALYLRYQNTAPEELIQLGGPGTDEYMTVSKENLADALKYDFDFRGPSLVINKEMQAQQMMQWFSTFGQFLPQHRQLYVAREAWDIIGLRGRDKILPDSDILAAQQAAMAPPEAPPAPGGPGMEAAPAEMAPPAALPPGEVMAEQAPEGAPAYMDVGEAMLGS
jgi:hypothetical protein